MLSALHLETHQLELDHVPKGCGELGLKIHSCQFIEVGSNSTGNGKQKISSQAVN